MFVAMNVFAVNSHLNSNWTAISPGVAHLAAAGSNGT